MSVAPRHRRESEAVLESKLAPLRRALARMGPERAAAMLEGLQILVEEVTGAEVPARGPGRRRVVSAIFGALGRGVVRLRWLVVIAWVVVTVLAVHAFPSLASQVNNNNSAFLPASAPSNQAAVLAQPLIGSINQSAGAGGGRHERRPTSSASDQAALKRAVEELETGADA